MTEETKGSSGSGLQKSLFSLAGSFALVSVFQRVITFALNQFLVRNTAPNLYGRASVNFELFLSSMLFLSREGIRLAILRVNSTVWGEMRARQSIINLLWIPAVLLSVLLAGLYITKLGDEDFNVIVLYNLGALLESVAEPWFCYGLVTGDIRPRIYGEGAACVVRALSTVVFVVYQERGMLGFGLAQLLYGFSYSLVLIVSSMLLTKQTDSLSIVDFLPRFSPQETVLYNVGGENFKVAIEMLSTVVLKHLSTEADKIVLSFSVSHYDKGVYAVVNNYCSLVARMVYFPMEETVRLIFPKHLRDMHSLIQEEFKGEGTVVDSSLRLKIEDKLKSMFEFLCSVIQLIFVFGLIVALFGPFYSKLFVLLFLGPKWYSDDVVKTTSCFSFYILVMGVNGVTEAFVQSIIDRKHLYMMPVTLAASSILFAISSSYLIGYVGTCGIVLSLIFGMICRIVFNFNFICNCFNSPHEYFRIQIKPVTVNLTNMTILPYKFLLLLILTALALSSSLKFLSTSDPSSGTGSPREYLLADMLHVITGIFCLIALVSFLLLIDTDYNFTKILINRNKSAALFFGNTNKEKIG